MKVALEHIRREMILALEVIDWRERMLFFKKCEDLVEAFKKAKDPLEITVGEQGNQIP